MSSLVPVQSCTREQVLDLSHSVCQYLICLFCFIISVLKWHILTECLKLRPGCHMSPDGRFNPACMLIIGQTEPNAGPACRELNSLVYWKKGKQKALAREDKQQINRKCFNGENGGEQTKKWGQLKGNSATAGNTHTAGKGAVQLYLIVQRSKISTRGGHRSTKTQWADSQTLSGSLPKRAPVERIAGSWWSQPGLRCWCPPVAG